MAHQLQLDFRAAASPDPALSLAAMDAVTAWLQQVSRSAMIATELLWERVSALAPGLAISPGLIHETLAVGGLGRRQLAEAEKSMRRFVLDGIAAACCLPQELPADLPVALDTSETRKGPRREKSPRPSARKKSA